MNLVFLGPPGVGKGTQAVRISERYSLEHISTGELLREQIAAATLVGRQVESLINHGQLVNDELMIKILSEHLSSLPVGNGYILDGFPRTLPQAKNLTAVAHIDAAVYFDAPEAALVDRISSRRVCSLCKSTFSANDTPSSICKKCGGALIQRDDDKPEIVLKRLEVYEGQTMPIIDYYDSLGLLLTVNASGSVKDVFNEATRLLDALETGENT